MTTVRHVPLEEWAAQLMAEVKGLRKEVGDLARQQASLTQTWEVLGGDVQRATSQQAALIEHLKDLTALLSGESSRKVDDPGLTTDPGSPMEPIERSN